MARKISILFVLQIVGQPRFAKRICMLQEQGYLVDAIAFDRPTHKGRVPPCEVTMLGEIQHGQYLARIPTLLKAIPVIRRKLLEADVVYCMGMDMSILIHFSSIGLKRVRIVEIADILPIQTRNGIIGKLVRYFDRLQSNAANLLVVTAPDFLDVYYRQWLQISSEGMVIENKLERSVASEHTSSASQGEVEIPDSTDIPKITIGYFGLLRCKWSWQVLIQLMKDNPDTHQLLLAGLPLNIDGFEKTINELPNVSYFGEYRSPVDLPKLYESVDIVWACYEPIAMDDWNHKWARPNRFYESCLYKKPMISRDGCNDSTVVKRHGLGFCVDDVLVDDAVNSLAKIDSEHIANWQSNVSILNDEIYVYTYEGEELGKTIQELVHSSKSVPS